MTNSSQKNRRSQRPTNTQALNDPTSIEPLIEEQQSNDRSPITNDTRTMDNHDRSNEENHHHQPHRMTPAEGRLQLKYGARHIVQLFIPVSIAMIFVVFLMRISTEYENTGQIMFVIYNQEATDNSTRFLQAVANAMEVVVAIIIVTVILLLLYVYRFYKTLYGWVLLSTGLVYFVNIPIMMLTYLKPMNVAIDIITLLAVLWNYAFVGMISVHWKAPLVMQQGYLLLLSACMALTFIKALPGWTVWTVLFVVSCWDLVAVLWSKGPLRILVETAEARNEQILPALIYSSAMAWFDMKVIPMLSMTTRSSEERAPTNSSETAESEPSERIRARDPIVTYHAPGQHGITIQQALSESREAVPTGDGDIDDHHHDTEGQRDGVKLGLGDFVFYSLLIGKAATYGDWTVILACFVSILLGLSLTLSLLSMGIGKALPALPISIAFGMCAFFGSNLLGAPFASKLAVEQIFL